MLVATGRQFTRKTSRTIGWLIENKPRITVIFTTINRTVRGIVHRSAAGYFFAILLFALLDIFILKMGELIGPPVLAYFFNFPEIKHAWRV